MNYKLDSKLVDMLNAYVVEISDEVKRSGADAVLSGKFKKNIINRTGELNRGPLPDSFFEKLFTDIVSISVSLNAPVKVSFLGPEGTFSNAALNEFFGASVDCIPCKTIQDVFSEVEKEKSDYGVVPVENSTEGSVNHTLDELIETGLYIIAERYVRISFSLLTNVESLADVKKLYTHPQPAGQAKGWIRANIPGAEIVYVDSTVKAAETAAETPGSAAIASEKIAGRFGLGVASAGIEDMRHNYTRFYILGRKPAPSTNNDKTSIVCSVKDKPGALMGILSPLSDAGINMTKIESRPDKKQLWRYNFFIDFLGNQNDESARKALDKMRMFTIFLKILGSYPSGNRE